MGIKLAKCNGNLDASWTKLVTCNVVKPSGAPSGTETAADFNMGITDGALISRQGFQRTGISGSGAYVTGQGRTL
jgi:hypothetical protein